MGQGSGLLPVVVVKRALAHLGAELARRDRKATGLRFPALVGGDLAEDAL